MQTIRSSDNHMGRDNQLKCPSSKPNCPQWTPGYYLLNTVFSYLIPLSITGPPLKLPILCTFTENRYIGKNESSLVRR